MGRTRKSDIICDHPVAFHSLLRTSFSSASVSSSVKWAQEPQSPTCVLGTGRRELVDDDAQFVVAVSILVLPTHRLGGRRHGEF